MNYYVNFHVLLRIETEPTDNANANANARDETRSLYVNRDFGQKKIGVKKCVCLCS